MSTENSSTKGGGMANYLPYIIIPVCFAIALLIFIFVMGDPKNFEGGDTNGHPLPGNYLAIVYKGGVIVPLLMTFFLLVVTFTIERFITLSKANGSGSVDAFVRRIKVKLSANDIDGALAECEVQQGSIGNVVAAVLHKYKQMTTETQFNKEQKIAAIHKELEEATALELPMLEKNLPILATIGSVATLFALLGTVIGMIKAFAAMSSAGAPDANALATGISEALVNTALGIGTSAVAIVCYNFFTNKIDGISYSIDEAGMSIQGTFSQNN